MVRDDIEALTAIIRTAWTVVKAVLVAVAVLVAIYSWYSVPGSSYLTNRI